MSVVEIASLVGAGSVSTASVEIVIPVLNEERVLADSVETLCRFLHTSFERPWRLTIVDNGSTDATWEVAAALAAAIPGVAVLRVDRRGKGAAVKEAWLRSTADIVVFMDADLSTGLEALHPLVSAVAAGHCEVAIGTRLCGGARISRRAGRELISRAYNGLLRVWFAARFSDATCGFKAVRTSVARPLLEKVEDDGWFFDTELLLLAQHNGARVCEVPVDWVEDVDSRVRVWRTAMADLRGVIRMSRTLAGGGGRVDLPLKTEPSAGLRRSMAFCVIGVVSAVIHVLAYLLLRDVAPLVVANGLALAVTMLANIEMNRQWTFNRISPPPFSAHFRGMLVFAVNYLPSTVAISLAGPGLTAECLTLLAVGVCMTFLRFTLLDRWVFAGDRRVLP